MEGSKLSENQPLGAAYHIKQVVIISVFSGLAVVAVALRLWARRMKNMSLELNDYLIIFGLVRATLSRVFKYIDSIVAALCIGGDFR